MYNKQKAISDIYAFNKYSYDYAVKEALDFIKKEENKTKYDDLCEFLNSPFFEKILVNRKDGITPIDCLIKFYMYDSFNMLNYFSLNDDALSVKGYKDRIDSDILVGTELLKYQSFSEILYTYLKMVNEYEKMLKINDRQTNDRIELDNLINRIDNKRIL